MTYFKSFTFDGRRSASKAFDAIDDNSDNDYDCSNYWLSRLF